MNTITRHYIDGAFVESHGREVMDIINPTNSKVIGRVTLADEEDTRHAIVAAKHAFASFGRTTKEERAKILCRLHEVVSARVDVGVGQTIMRDGAATMKRVTLELGGKSPNILLDDANLEKAIPTALIIAFLNSGQACAAGTRLLVPRKRLDAVRRAIVDAIAEFPVGDPSDPKTAVGPMMNQKQYERVQSYIRKGIEEGAEVLIGGEGHPRGLDAGYFVKPTVFVNVTNDMTIAREEIFGPVLCVIAYETDEDAIRIANDTNFGLHAFVSGTDIQRARRVASQILAGRVAINGMLDDQQAPFGGFKHSGVGREFGTFGIEAFLEPRAILE